MWRVKSRNVWKRDWLVPDNVDALSADNVPFLMQCQTVPYTTGHGDKERRPLVRVFKKLCNGCWLNGFAESTATD